ncbi:autophagy protein Atg27, putative [Talaromyces stipitatus ATCC 10500]|uniref:Autophagy-related protein 27 n=1 Tax=Talaromyces stipitatus (strain ATCC 10500 / CBS 375.48 / QM 6759 / NRRL 1006) TaxID=441959 RepID=B8M1S8_TALSN|nr:autophagy protein Atg27, putative [Talaromyces stipitatus ATCC 10500]EED22165.1 autophagy protein Atg27, putative [Talaromyces stipitatus ATCC 10500]
MRTHTQRSTLAGLASSLLLLLPSFTYAISLDCANIIADKVKFDLSPLGGVHEITEFQEIDDISVNTTYVLNICNTLKGAATREGQKCGTSRNICGFERTIYLDGRTDTLKVLPIAGYENSLGGGSKDIETTLLKSIDPATEGIRVKISGGTIPEPELKKKYPASAIIDFQCDPGRTGLEGLKNDDDLDQATDAKLRRRDDGEKGDDGNNKDGDENNKPQTPSLTFQSFSLENENFILRLDWKTKYACEDYKRDNPGSGSGNSSSGHWGFFTWLIIILFLCIASYLIFGSWLNYNRYGARGWDLLPHSDTIRDIPYIFNDWMRRVINTLQGSGGSRGGYAAV